MSHETFVQGREGEARIVQEKLNTRSLGRPNICDGQSNRGGKLEKRRKKKRFCVMMVIVVILIHRIDEISL